MTAAMLLVMPSIVVAGTVIGSVLRKFSREAQAQVINLIVFSGVNNFNAA